MRPEQEVFMGYPRSAILSILENDGFDALAEAIASIDERDLKQCGVSVSGKNHLIEIEDLLAAAAGRIKKINNFLD